MKNNSLEKINKGLKCCATQSLEGCRQCPYNKSKPLPQCRQLLLTDTIELLEEDEILLGKQRGILNALYGKEAMEELK